VRSVGYEHMFVEDNPGPADRVGGGYAERLARQTAAARLSAAVLCEH